MKKTTHYMADVHARHRSKREFILHALFRIIFDLNNYSTRKTKDVFQLLDRKLQNLKKTTKHLKFSDGVIGTSEIELRFQENFPKEHSALLSWREGKGTKK